MNTDRFTDWDSSGLFADDDPVTKSTPSLSDVHAPTSVSLVRRKKKMKPKAGEVEVQMSLEKVEDDQRMAWGWASVTTRNGQPLEDLQGDVIETEELQKAVHEFVRKKRIMGEMHTVIGTGDIVDSIVFTNDIQKALGIDLGKEGWFVGVHVTNDGTWSKVKKGELRGFSLGGFGVRELMKSMEDDESFELDVEDLDKRLDFIEQLEARLEKMARKPAGAPGGTGGQFTSGPAGFGNGGVARKPAGGYDAQNPDHVARRKLAGDLRILLQEAREVSRTHPEKASYIRAQVRFHVAEAEANGRVKDRSRFHDDKYDRMIERNLRTAKKALIESEKAYKKTRNRKTDPSFTPFFKPDPAGRSVTLGQSQ